MPTTNDAMRCVYEIENQIHEAMPDAPQQLRESIDELKEMVEALGTEANGQAVPTAEQAEEE